MIYILYEDDEGNISVEGKISIDNHGVINEFYNSKKFTYNFENLNFQVKYRGQVRKIFNIIKNRWIYI